ncbi:MAG: DegT/DnrJ/EryC1/StrS family aminotransferase [Alphaproteobacteria bacterium]|nr:DegT/DnrJ/EryC1/StrS family aminotransferase [Alphaproteobacteria bacterium]
MDGLPSQTSLKKEPHQDLQSWIPVYRPNLSGNERRYVLECLDSTWISSKGHFIDDFEQAFARQLGHDTQAAAVCNGTVALHLALHVLGIGPGDEVIVPTFTYIASVNTIAQTGATPVFAECHPETWLIDPADVKKRITPKTKAILPVHLYGNACDMKELAAIAKSQNLLIIEDCAESFGTTLDGQPTGTFGTIGTFSFFGNKTITTGEGGMLVASNPALMDNIRITKGQGMSPERRYWHDRLGFNYRMTNIQAAIGLAQLERLNGILARKRQIGAMYRKKLQHLPVTFQQAQEGVESSEWLFSLLIAEAEKRDPVMDFMAQRHIETRPVFHCAHLMPMYRQNEGTFPIAENIANRGISLPSYPDLTESDIDRVCEALEDSLHS